MPLVDPQTIADAYLDAIKAEVATLPPIKLVGLVASNDRATQVYTEYSARGCERVGIGYSLERLVPEEVSRTIYERNADPAVHGVMVYYPVFGGTRDRSLQNEVAPEKDVEGLHAVWSGRLYHDVRTLDPDGTKKAVLPCTPLAVIKILESLGVYRLERGPRHQADGLVVTVFNRSEVVGRPLAAMLAHDGAQVFSFDVDGPVLYEDGRTHATDIDRTTALARSDVVITGVPSRDFPLVRAGELKDGATCVNVSHMKNLADDVVDRAAHTVLRVGPVTVTMLLRNTLRLFRNFHHRP